MSFALSADQLLIQESARTFLAETAGLERLRATIESGAGFDAATWDGLAGTLGFAGLMIPESYGGSGLGALEMALVLEETGRTLAQVPFFETAVLATTMILLAATHEQKRVLLPDIAAGRSRVAIAMTGSDGLPCPEGVSVELTPYGQGWQLSGTADFVTFADVADCVLVVARAPGTTASDGLSLIVVPKGTPGISIERVPNLDLTRPFGRIVFAASPVAPEAVLGAPGAVGTALERALAIGAGLLSAEQTGAAAFCLSSTVEYAKQRVQFGRPIGSFQAVKHELADMMMWVEAARSAVFYAAAAIDGGGDDLFEAASIARVWCTEAFRRCASEMIQLHGGIGFTWEHHAHLYFKRARSSTTWLGEPALHRERIAKLMGLDEDVS